MLKEIQKFYYGFSGLTLVSFYLLPELPALRLKPGVSPDLYLLLSVRPPGRIRSWIHHQYTSDDALTLSLGKTTNGSYLLRFPELADFIITKDNRHISAWSSTGVSDETVRHLLLDQVLPRVIAQSGRLVLHAGGVLIDKKVVAFIGETGRGKSSLVADLNRMGFRLLTDDGLVIDHGGMQVCPTYPSLRLWPEAIAELFIDPPPLAPMAHYSTKQRVLMDDVPLTHDRQWPLAAVYVLGDGSNVQKDDAVVISRLSPRDACMELIRHAFQLDPTDPVNAARMLAMTGDVAANRPVYRLDYPREYSRLSVVRDAILEHIGYRQGSGAGQICGEGEKNE